MRHVDSGPRRLYLLPLESTTVSLAGSLYGMVVSYLIQMSDGTNILVDSGIPADYQPPAGAPPHTHETNVVMRLADLELHPDDIDLLICTRIHILVHVAPSERAAFHRCLRSSWETCSPGYLEPA